MEDIYNLGLHESCNITPDLGVTRVPGGWIYRFWDYENDYYPNTGIFVPFDNEFQNK